MPARKRTAAAKAPKNDTRKPAAARAGANPKLADLDVDRETSAGQFLTSNQGLRVNDNQNSLKAGPRGPSLLEDFLLREKITHFDHERIPERVVHARGSAAHGYFQVYEPLSRYSKAAFLQDPKVRTPVFVRFSTVAGSRGSTDLARDVRGFAVKFYTSEGNFDLVGNNMPVFFIQDAIKFPDLVHAVKPEPRHEMPQAASAHDTFWDFISRMPESMHMIMWVMSDRAIPRSYRMMEGFGVHTFRLVNDRGQSRFVKFHWKPVLGIHGVVWDEAQKISGKDPDFHRRDLWEAIESGSFPEWELGLQIVEEKDEHKFAFDLLDPTKIIPEEEVPVQRVGRLVLDRNPDNFFAETEQVAFHLGNIVPGIDFTNDPLLQGRLFSYLDTQLLRLGGPNFHEIPINRPVAPVHNNQRDGFHRQTINTDRTSYDPNGLSGGCPFQAGVAQGGFASHAERIDAHKVRERSPSFRDHFSQATLFYRSQTEVEQFHIVRALRFELGKVEEPAVRSRMLFLLNQVDKGLAGRVASGLGMEVPGQLDSPMNLSVPADVDPRTLQPKRVTQAVERSEALSMVATANGEVRTRRVAVLAADGFEDAALTGLRRVLTRAGVQSRLVAPRLGMVTGSGGLVMPADYSLLTASSVLFDAVYVLPGAASARALAQQPDALEFVAEAFKHCKTIGASGEGAGVVEAAIGTRSDEGLVVREGFALASATDFVTAMGRHRHWSREKMD
jgi:catalase